MDKPTGFLHRFDPDGTLTTWASGITLSNSLMWSPDSTVMYFCDSMKKEFYAYDFNAESGAIASKRDFARADRFAIPDGSIVNVEGYLWNAECDMTADSGNVRRAKPRNILRCHQSLPHDR